jgi:ABC-type arginine transport system permease subunit
MGRDFSIARVTALLRVCGFDLLLDIVGLKSLLRVASFAGNEDTSVIYWRGVGAFLFVQNSAISRLLFAKHFLGTGWLVRWQILST